ncbi:unnamed protein product, partial [Lymnaea stagnalis]
PVHILSKSEFLQKHTIPSEGVLIHQGKTSNVVASVGESDHLAPGLSQPITTRPDCQLCELTVTTDAERRWIISESDLQHSNNILEDKENLPRQNITNCDGSPKPVVNNLKQVNSPQQMSPHASNPPHTALRGFSTAAG